MVLPLLHSLDRLPRNLSRASSRRRCERKATPPQPGHQPCPASDAQLLRPSVGQGCAQYGGVSGAGISFRCAKFCHPSVMLAQASIHAKCQQALLEMLGAPLSAAAKATAVANIRLARMAACAAMTKKMGPCRPRAPNSLAHVTGPGQGDRWVGRATGAREFGTISASVSSARSCSIIDQHSGSKSSTRPSTSKMSCDRPLP